MRNSSRQQILAVTVALLGAALGSTAVRADTAVAIRAGTLGIGPELTFGLTPSLNARIGYTAWKYSETVDDTDATYDGDLKLSNASALLDWHPGGRMFRLSVGGVATSNKIEVTGVPTGGTFELGNASYPTSQVTSVTGSVKAGNGVAPYVGIGIGNPVDEAGRFTFMLDLGVIFTGTPKVSLTATCAASVSSTVCAQIQQSAAQEIADLRSDVDQLKIWPVLSLGFAYRF